jgi:hypothetical protein
MTTTTNPGAGLTTGALARKEIVHYLRHPLFVLGVLLLAAVTWMGATDPDALASTSLDGLAPGALLGLLGMVVMASLTKRSDRAAEAAGAVSVSQRTRTLALASATVVPVTCALVWFLAAVLSFQKHPPLPGGVQFGGVDDGFFFATMFAQGVMAAVGGPVLGLLIGRWLPRRGVAPVAVVLIVLVTIVMQGLFESTRSWRVVWPWTHFYGPMGAAEDADRFVVLTGSPYVYVAYLAALCVLGLLLALLRDPDADRRRLARVAGAVAAVALALLVLTIVGGYDQTLVNPLSSAG